MILNKDRQQPSSAGAPRIPDAGVRPASPKSCMVTMLGWLSMATKRDRGFQRARPKLSPSCGEASRFFAMKIPCERANLNAAQIL
jgi:hypothetical protein